MTHAATEISNLLFRYAERLDAGDLEGVAELFRHARIQLQPGTESVDAAALLHILRTRVKRYPCGTPRTKHIVSNPIIEIDAAGRHASARSYYTVLQATEGFALQPIASGRYHDAFECVDNVWRFAFRDYSMLDAIGNLSFHLDAAAAPGDGAPSPRETS
jgi:3-phenylpropionate/cinnamic acid dioxygenase small subunit